MKTGAWICLVLAGAVVAGCAVTDDTPAMSLDEVVYLSQGEGEHEQLYAALKIRPLGFPLTWESFQELHQRGVPEEALNQVIAISGERREWYSVPYYWGWWWDPYMHFWPYGYWSAVSDRNWDPNYVWGPYYYREGE